MRTSTIGAAILLAGAGAASLAAANNGDTTGSSLALNGSDTLHDVTVDVLSACGVAFGAGSSVTTLSYLGGGSGVGAGQMDIGNQGVSPMSRALASTEFCSQPAANGIYSGTVSSVNGAAEGILAGIDGVGIGVNQVTSCANSSTNVPAVVGANGFGATSMPIQTGGTGATTGVSYTFGDPAAAIYKNQPSFDALAVLYFGLTHDGIYGGCASDTRKTLIKNWKNLFSTDCTAGDGTCTAGVTHAWRRSDLSGTTDAFVSVLNPPGGTDTNLKGFARDATGAIVLDGSGNPTKLSMGIGTLSTAPVKAAKKSNPFCNSVDGNSFVNLAATPQVSAVTSFGGSSDFSDLDPVRTVCNAGDGVCQASQNFATAGGGTGDLGVVMPILLPDGTIVNKATDVYPAQHCSASCTLVSIGSTSVVAGNPGIKCPGGSSPILNGCYMPFFNNGGDQDPRCISAQSTKCAGAPGRPDGRVYNNVVVVNASVYAGTVNGVNLGAKHGNKEYQYGQDANFRLLNGSYFRLHSNTAAPTYASGLGSETGTTGICTADDDTSQIGCLIDSDPCSVGYAGRELAKGYPGLPVTDPVTLVTSIVPTSQSLKALAVNGTPPYTPGADADLALENLLVSGTPSPLYPLARRLYFNTIYGFSNLTGGERQLAQCYGTDSVVGPAILAHGFVKVPGGVKCIDYPEAQGTTTPAPNVNGSGNAALGGCGTAGVNTDACTAFPLLETDGVTTLPEATETF